MLAVKKAISTAEGLDAIVTEIRRVLGLTRHGKSRPNLLGHPRGCQVQLGTSSRADRGFTLIASVFVATFQRSALERARDNEAMTGSPVTIRVVVAESGRPLQERQSSCTNMAKPSVDPQLRIPVGRIECSIQPGEYDLASLGDQRERATMDGLRKPIDSFQSSVQNGAQRVRSALSDESSKRAGHRPLARVPRACGKPLSIAWRGWGFRLRAIEGNPRSGKQSAGRSRRLPPYLGLLARTQRSNPSQCVLVTA